MLADDDDELLTTAVKSQGSQQPAWMRTLFERCREWLGELPEVCVVCFSLVLDLGALVEILYFGQTDSRTSRSIVSLICPRGFHWSQTSRPCAKGPSGHNQSLPWRAEANKSSPDTHERTYKGYVLIFGLKLFCLKQLLTSFRHDT
jgi:hypothetical protein